MSTKFKTECNELECRILEIKAMVKELDEEEIQTQISDFVRAAILAQSAGYDGVEKWAQKATS